MRQTNKAYVMTIVISVIATFSSCARQANENPTAAKNMAMIQAYVDAANRGDASYLDEYLAPDYVHHGPARDLDANGFKAFHQMVLFAFPGLTFTIDDMFAAGDEVVTRWTLHGVQKGEFRGIAPTGKAVTVTGIIISRFENGRVVEEWEEANMAGMMQQLGATAPPPNEG
jgi:steroid delta-isomerase-like uncharacterized protein